MADKKKDMLTFRFKLYEKIKIPLKTMDVIIYVVIGLIVIMVLLGLFVIK